MKENIGGGMFQFISGCLLMVAGIILGLIAAVYGHFVDHGVLASPVFIVGLSIAFILVLGGLDFLIAAIIEIRHQ